MTLRFQVFLFKNCCNKCDFCFQDKMLLNNYYDFDILQKNRQVLIESIKAVKNPEQYETILITLFGGEMFCWDSVELCNFYFSLIEDITKLNLPNIKLRIVSNLLYKDLYYVKKFIEYTQFKNINLVVATSFDFESRFHSLDKLDLFFNNYKTIQQIYPKITIVCTLTKELCQHFTNKNNSPYFEVFDYIYNNNPEDIEWLMYLKNANKEHNEQYLPSDKDLFNFYLGLKKHYPIQYAQWFKQFENKIKRPCFSEDIHNLIANGKLHNEYNFLLDSNDINTPFYRKCHYSSNNSTCLTCEYNYICQKLCYCCFEFSSPNKFCYLKELHKLNA